MTDQHSNQIECAHCGTSFYYELNECPNCGINVYFPDDEDNPAETSELFTHLVKVFRLPFAVLVGWVVTVGVGFSIYLPIRFAFTAPHSSLMIYAWIILSLSLGAFAGGFAFARIVQKAINVGSVLISIAGIAIAIMMSLSEWGIVLPLSLGTLVGWVLIVVASFWGAYIADKMMKEVLIDDLFSQAVKHTGFYENLLAKVGHDHAVVERLIEHERQRAPKATRSELIQNAISRWERDNQTRNY
jgi:uncharacterized protein YneF (UPF0154 family)